MPCLNCSKDCDCTWLFLYGSLKQEFHLNPVIEELRIKHHSYENATLDIPARLYRVSPWFPCLRLGKGDYSNSNLIQPVKGELVKVKRSSFKILDEVESDMYFRTEVPVIIDNTGERVDANCYVWDDEKYELFKTEEEEKDSYIVTGIWRT